MYKNFHKTYKQPENIWNKEKEQLTCETGIGRHQEISNLMRVCTEMVAELQPGCERRSGDAGVVERRQLGDGVMDRWGWW